MAKSKNGGLGDSVKPAGGMLVAFIFRADPDDVIRDDDGGVASVPWEFDEFDVLFRDVSFEEAEEYVEAHRGRMVAIEKQRRLESKIKHEGEPHLKVMHKAVYQWVPHSAGVRLATVEWKEYCDGEHGGGMGFILRMLGG